MSSLFSEALARTEAVTALPVWDVAFVRRVGRTSSLVYTTKVHGINPYDAAKAVAAGWLGPHEQIVVGGIRFRVWETDRGVVLTTIDPTPRNRKGDRARARVS
jgi:hypothetical protein